jgi:hypothetical protein
MRFRHIVLTGLLIVAPAGVPASAGATARALPTIQGTPHDELHSRMEREHQQWHFANDRGPRDRNWNREHDKFHQRQEQKHAQWHRQNSASDAASRKGDSGRKPRKAS